MTEELEHSATDCGVLLTLWWGVRCGVWVLAGLSPTPVLGGGKDHPAQGEFHFLLELWKK